MHGAVGDVAGNAVFDDLHDQARVLTGDSIDLDHP